MGGFLLALPMAAAGECIDVEGRHILGSDLARAHRLFAGIPPETRIGFAPYPGAERIVRGEELQRLATKFHMEAIPLDAVCFRYRTAPLEREALEKALREELGEKEGRIEIVDYSKWPAPQGTLHLLGAERAVPDHTGAMRFRGVVRYGEGRSVPFWVRAKVESVETRLVAVEPLAAGKQIQPGQVRVESGPGMRTGEKALVEPSAAVGKAPRRKLEAGAAILASQLQAPRLVEPGDEIQLVAASGAARISLKARAESGGRLGDRILVKNATSGRRIPARVSGPGKAQVEVEPAR